MLRDLDPGIPDLKILLAVWCGDCLTLFWVHGVPPAGDTPMGDLLSWVTLWAAILPGLNKFHYSLMIAGMDK